MGDTSKSFKPTSNYSEIGYDPQNFSLDLSNFLFSQTGARYKTNILLDGDLTCNSPAPPIIATKTGFQYDRFTGPTQHAPARRKVEKVMDSHQLASSRTFSHSKIYAAWETDETIAKELWRNMGLAMMCVFVITLLLLANVKICVLVLLCVILTLVDIVGMLHFWGITIDTLSCVNIVLAIGLCVDYSAHIAHAFMVAEGSAIERSQTALSLMGPAIINGGITTFLAVFPLLFSASHVFQTFFKVFFLTVTFGLFHGIIFLPVVLSWIGSNSSKTTISELGLNGSNSDIESRDKQIQSDITTSNEKYIPTYNSMQGNHSVSNSNGDNSTPKGYSNGSGKRWNPFNRFQQTLAINE